MEKLLIGEVIYNLRKEKEITQEQLAGFIGVSSAAVSKWESGTSYPDITLLPLLACFFNVSVDRLLNFKIELSDEECMRMYAECERLFSTSMLDEAMEKCKEYIAKYPRSYLLRFRIGFLFNMYSWKWMDEEKCKEMLKQSIVLYEDIVQNCSRNELVEQALFQLGALYPSIGEHDKAIDALNKLKKNRLDPDILLASIHIERNEMKQAREILQTSLYRNIHEAGLACMGIANSYMKESMDLDMIEKYYELARKLKQVVDLEDDNAKADRPSINLAMDYLNLSQVYMKFNKSDLAMQTLIKMLEELKRNDINEYGNHKHIWCFNEMPTGKRTITMNLYENILILLKHPMFDSIRTQEDFQSLFEQIDAMYRTSKVQGQVEMHHLFD